MGMMGIVQEKQFRDAVNRILHLPGNAPGKILEMTLVADGGLTGEEVSVILPEAVKQLKNMGETFRNVRFNYVEWREDNTIKAEVIPMMQTMTEAFYQDWHQTGEKKKLENLTEWLKKYQARSKLVLILAPEELLVEDERKLKDSLQPFLGRKMLKLEITDGHVLVKCKFY